MELFERYPELSSQREAIELTVSAIVHAYEKGGKVLVCGNGGSSSDSAHVVGELCKSFILPRPIDKRTAKRLEEMGESELIGTLQGGIKAIDLTAQSAIISAFANDCDASAVYAQLVYVYAEKNDLVIGLSTSGNSANVVKALKVAKAKGATAVALTGERPSECSKVADACIMAPSTETYLVQEYHLPIYHYICAEAERRIFGGKR